MLIDNAKGAVWMAAGSNNFRHFVYNLFVAVIILSLISLLFTGCGKKDEKTDIRSWIDSEYTTLSDSLLQQMVDNNDTLAAITLGWRYLQNKDNATAAILFKDFNTFYDKANPDLTYLSALSFQASGMDSLALQYIESLLKEKSYPEAKYLAATSLFKLKDYDGAIKIYGKLRKLDKEAIGDSILRCKAEQGDTLSGITFARKMLGKNKITMASPYYGRYVSLSRGVSPPLWSYEAGQTFYKGHNYTRAAVFFENADADTNFAELSVWAGKSYYMLQVYDSAASKLSQAIEMGDSTKETIYLLVLNLSGDGKQEKTLEACRLGISIHPDDERFYFAPAKNYYDTKDYQSLKELAEYGLTHVKSSYKIEAYNIAANVLLGNEDVIDSLIDRLIFNHRFSSGALNEAAKLFQIGLQRDDIVARLEEADISKIHPGINSFLFWYQRLKDEGNLDSAKHLLEIWLEGDTVEERLEFIRDLYKRDFPEK
jgi:hypothetical protein